MFNLHPSSIVLAVLRRHLKVIANAFDDVMWVVYILVVLLVVRRIVYFEILPRDLLSRRSSSGGGEEEEEEEGTRTICNVSTRGRRTEETLSAAASERLHGTADSRAVPLLDSEQMTPTTSYGGPWSIHRGGTSCRRDREKSPPRSIFVVASHQDKLAESPATVARGSHLTSPR